MKSVPLETFIDHTLLNANATIVAVKKLCEEAKKHHFYAVCVNGCHIALAKKELENTDIKLAAVIGFPLGAMSSRAKVFEAREYVKNGADEIDMVINIGLLKSGRNDEVREEIAAVKAAMGDIVLKVIIETCYLSDQEKRIACQLAVEAKADFVKTSTGFGPGGATIEDVRLMKEVIGNKARIKASGGIKNREAALKYIEAGVSRIGTSSGIAIVTSN